MKSDRQRAPLPPGEVASYRAGEGNRAAAENCANIQKGADPHRSIPRCLSRRERRFSPPSAVLVGLLVIAGCAEPTTGEVTGTVTVDGTPAKEGSIAFFPVNGKSSTAGAPIIDGKYTATVPLGQAKVQIRVPKVVGQKPLYNTPNSPIQPIMDESLPPKYNDASELTLDVQPGENRQDYDLATK